jgi:hypothetical protein
MAIAMCTRVRTVGSEKDERGEQGRVTTLSALHMGTKARENDGRHSSEMVGCSARMVDTSRTRVVHWGCLWAELGNGPKSKVEAHITPYILYLRYIVIRATD